MNIIDKIRSIAEQLSNKRSEIFALEEALSRAVHPLKQERELLQKKLLDLLRSNDLKGIKTSAGENYTRSIRKSMNIADYALAEKWAVEHGVMKIDMKVCEARIKEMGNKLPAGFEWVESEYMSIRKPKSEDATSNNENDNDE